MDKSRFKIEFRQKQLVLDNDDSDPVVVVCTDGVASYVPGTVPRPDWEDMTDFTDADTLDALKLTWSATSANYSRGASSSTDSTNSIGSNYDKAVTGDFTFHGAAFNYIYDWLMLTPCQSLNSIEVRITDLICNKAFRPFELKLDNTDYAPFDAPCVVSLSLREQDDTIHVFKKTIIEDDWQKWFNSDGTSTKDHPTMMYIVEKKPAFITDALVVIAYLTGILSGGVATLFTDLKRWYRKILGISYYSPAPLIRTYIMNVCMKYGITWNTIFDDDIANPYRDATVFFPVNQFYTNNDDIGSPSTKFIWDNRTGMPMSEFLDQLRDVFNAEWYVTPNKELVFQNRAFFQNQPILIDFTLPVAPRLYDFKYTFNGDKKPAYGRYEYRLDPQDSNSNDLKWRYNDIVDFDGAANNPMLEGSINKNFQFSQTSFMYDGATTDFIDNAIKAARAISIGAILVGLTAILLAASIFTGAIAAALCAAGYAVVNGFFTHYIENSDLQGAVRVASNVINVPRLLLYDRNTPIERAKVVSVTNPVINPYYNVDNVDYYAEHPAFDAPDGYFGDPIVNVYNYPFYVDANYKNNLYDRFHEIDNPLNNPEINQEFTASLDLCCDMLTLFGCWEDDFIKIGAVVVVERRADRLIKARITHIEPDYSTAKLMIEGKILK